MPAPWLFPSVEGQEVGFLAPQSGRHPHLVGVHREVDKRALLESEEKIAFISLVLVLANRMGSALSGQLVLEFRSNDGDAIERKGHVDDAAAVLAVCLPHDRGERDLARDGLPVLVVVLRRLGVHSRVRPEKGHAEDLAVAFEPVAKDVERALDVQLLRQTVQRGCSGLRPEKRLQRLPLGWLAVLQETSNIVGEEGERFVIGPRVSLLVAAGGGQSGFNL